MSLYSKHSYKLSVKRARRRRRPRRATRSLRARSYGYRAGKSVKHMVGKAKLSEKLEALKKLIPTQNGEILKADQLFEETADYIVLLRTRVVILQKLIEFYGNSSENENAVS
ncbi:hypothetical protein L6164_007536 [Bauhinia variegata]|uniref:Uncharacterized protein n=1 Tax=Bauhinia variegata TaxID=167791 RepID=A0ACB9PDE8_BAUVA|nr:hypothetical protein L6164_007536 [Bauhinia variegata]